ncbi:MAG TPA: type II secretion system F family protein [Bryobacteraceae bacterium]|nr:type II secretion system F family protein [Bryobacteraceae bacterium]
MFIAIAVVFLVIFAVILLCVKGAFFYFKSRQKQQILSMLRTAEARTAGQRETQFLKPADIEDALAKLLSRFRFMEKLNLIIQQSGQSIAASKLISLSCLTFAVAFFLGLKLHFISAQLNAVVLGSLGGAIPLLVILRKRRKAIDEFEKQFPEALDFLSRSMRAGHGFSIALEMLAADSPDPLGAAFKRVSNDLQLGSALDVALNKILIQVPTVDVRFFVSAVLLQQETGGNLGEILSKLASIIRERFRLKGTVKAVSAHGRITGMVLVLMPVGVTLIMMVTSPAYLADLAADEFGRKLIYGAIGGQIVGYLVIKKIINIKV